jgi:DHA2 family multidrug resistance protein
MSPAITAEQASSMPKVNPWLIGVVVSLAAFMEVLDTSIANVALPHIAGSLGAGSGRVSLPH